MPSVDGEARSEPGPWGDHCSSPAMFGSSSSSSGGEWPEMFGVVIGGGGGMYRLSQRPAQD